MKKAKKKRPLSAMFRSLPPEAQEAIRAHFASMGARGGRQTQRVLTREDRRMRALDRVRGSYATILKHAGLPVPETLKQSLLSPSPTPNPASEGNAPAPAPEPATPPTA